MKRYAAGPTDAAAADLFAAEPSCVGRTRTTCVATMLSGGDAENAPPQTATATVNCRVFPGTSVDALTSPMRKDVEAAVSKALHSV